MKKILFIVSLFVFCIGVCCIVNITPDNDLWARLIAGSFIVENLAVLKHDILSYTPTHIWYDHEWGASVFFYLALKYFGAEGLIFLKGILSAFTLFFCFKTIELREPKSTNPYNILYYLFMFFVVSNFLGAVVRCLLFTCLFFSIFLYILERYRKKGGKCLIWLPFLMILWSNIHGGCISAFGLFVIYILGEYLNKKPVKPYIYVSIACLAALFINPYGFEYVKFLFFAAGMDRSFITEWLSPFHSYNLTHHLRYKFYLVFIFVIQFLYLLKNKIKYEVLDKTKFLLVLAMAYLSITHTRHVTFFVFTAGTLMYEEFYFLVNYLLDIIKIKDERINRNINIVKEGIVYLSIFVFALPLVLAPNKQVRITETAYPRFAVEFIKINNLKGNLFVNFDWGSYAAYKLYPNNLIVMDGRYEEVYNPELLIELKNFHRVQGDWYKIIREYNTDVMIIEKKYPVYDEIKNHPDWIAVFENNFSGVFVPKNKQKDKYLYPIPSDEYYNKNVFRSFIYPNYR